MLQLKNVTKDYTAGDTTVRALKEVSLSFRKTEFVSILGASGCGKTTLLNIIGGLDRYTSGDLIINGRSTKEYKDKDWDAYRNNSIGFVFQTYNLISHISVLQNVELALTLSGIGIEERKNRAIAALQEVGLEAQINKKPNQLSGGQMQRVAIARAIVNNPEIILADEPTGALDSKTSVQIMELLKEVSRNRLVIMVTHNAELAEQYSTRIVRISDGEIVGDTAPFDAEAETETVKDVAATAETESSNEEKPIEIKEDSEEVAADIAIQTEEIEIPVKTKKRREKKIKKPQTSMSFLAALSLSLKNLFTKKGRTFITAFAGSIGIIGIGLVLAVSNGINGYISDMEKSFMSNSEMRIQRVAIDYTYMFDAFYGDSSNQMEMTKPTFPDDGVVGIYSNEMFATMINSVTFSDINENFKTYLKNNLSAESYNTIEYGYDISFNVVKSDLTIDVKQFRQMVSNENFVKANYDVLEGEITDDKFDVVLVVDGNNKITASTFDVLGITDKTTTLKELVGKKIKVAYNDTVYFDNGSGFKYADGATISASDRDDPDLCYELNVSAVLRMKNSAEVNSFLSRGIYFNQSLASYVLEHEADSAIVLAQKELMKSPLNPGKLLPGVLPDQDFYKSVLDGGYITDMENFGDIEGMLGAMGQSFTISKYSLGTINADNRYNSVSIYPTSFDAKNEVLDVIRTYNASLPEGQNGVTYSDTMQLAFDTVSEVTDIVTYALIAFIAISLIVSTVMIGVITYVSVVERTKEIGILRAIGARKKDVSRVFNAETFIVGAMAGIIGILIAYLISIPANYILRNLTGIMGLVVLNPLHAFILVVISVALTLISGLIPARIAAKKDPILCLRTE